VSYKKALSNLLYLRPQDAHLNLGVAYLSRKEYPKAAEHLQKAIKLVPDYAAAHNSLGQAYEGLQRYGEARRSYEKAVEFNPNYPRAYLNLGKLLIRAGDRLAAVKSLNQVMKLAPDSDMAREARLYLNKLK
jgi:tetratricopeptide (TPR) repeat protein